MGRRSILKVPPGLSAEHLKGGATPGIVALRPSPTVIKLPHSSPADLARCAKEGTIYSHLSLASGGLRPRSLLAYRGRAEAGILLEFAAQGSVREYYSNGNTPPRGAVLLRWARQAAEALSFCHSHGVLHGDICCGNFFLTHDLDLKVGDFASSSWKTETTQARYSSAAHQLPDAETVTAQTEMFAFGSALYEMVSGVAPFAGLAEEEVESRFRRGEFPDLSRAEVLRGVIAKCWGGEYDSMEDVRKAILAEIKAESKPTVPKAPQKQSFLVFMISAVVLGHIARHIIRLLFRSKRYS